MSQQQSALRLWRRGPFKVLFAHHREHEAHHVVMVMVVAAALSLIATIFVAGAAGYVAVASRIRHADTYWFPFAIAGAVAAHIGYTFAYREVAHVGRGVKLGALRAGAIVAAGFGMFIPRGGFAVDIEALLPFALVWVGYSLPAAVLAVFAYRVFNLWLPLGPSAFALYHLQRRAPDGAAR